MSDDEERIRALLHRGVPHPTRKVTLDEVKAAVRQDQGTDGDIGARRRSRVGWAPILSAAVVVAIAVAVALVLTERDSGRHPASSTGTTTASSTTSSATPQPTATSADPTPSAVVAACQTPDLSASVGRRGSTASAPFLVVVFRNHSTTPCTVSGYPSVQPFSGAQRLTISVQHGTYEIPDAGPHDVTIQPDGAASFAFGTTTGNSGGSATITRLDLQISASAQGPITLVVPGGIGATRANGQFPVGITALVSGANGQ